MSEVRSPRRLCVFCGSSPGNRPGFRAAAEELGTAIARRGWEAVYGGGTTGLMGVVADACLKAGGSVTGVMPHFMCEKEIDHPGLTRFEVVESMHERKVRMAELADGFIALPGGYGTFEEFFEAVTWTQLGLHDKPCVLLNVEGYYDPVVQLLDGAVAAGFLKESNRAIVWVCTTVGEAFAEIERWQTGRAEEKWIKL